MAAISIGSSGCPAHPVSECNQRYAALIEADRTAVLTSYARNLETLCTAGNCGPRFREHAVAEAVEIINDVVKSVAAGEVRLAPYSSAVWAIDRSGDESCPSPIDRLRTARALFHVAVVSLASHFSDDPALLPCFTTAVLALNESISRRVGEATAAYTRFQLDRVCETQVEERRRIARDLHDRLGERLSVGLRQLDLLEIAGREDSPSHNEIARKVLTDAMERLRVVTSDLREEPVTSLEKALIHYLDSANAEAEVQLRVRGDEPWAPPSILDEVFLIIWEAVRNALTHASPRLVLIDVDLTPHELRALVKDDGRGFMPDMNAVGTGLASMRERASLMGGRLTVFSRPGNGTSVELIVSLPGHCHEWPG